MALRPTQPPVQWVPGALSLGVKQLGCEADHSPPSSAEVKECLELYLHFPIHLHGLVLSLGKERKSTGRSLQSVDCLGISREQFMQHMKRQSH
jgi:hypothetical protein